MRTQQGGTLYAPHACDTAANLHVASPEHPQGVRAARGTGGQCTVRRAGRPVHGARPRPFLRRPTQPRALQAAGAMKSDKA